MQPIYFTRTANAMFLAIFFLILFIGLLLGMFLVDSLASWWFLLVIIGVAGVFYTLSLFYFIRMEFYEEVVLIRHLLKPRNADQFFWKDIKNIEYNGEQVPKPFRITINFVSRKRPFVFSVKEETAEVRENVLAMFREKEVEIKIMS